MQRTLGTWPHPDIPPKCSPFGSHHGGMDPAELLPSLGSTGRFVTPHPER